MRARKHENANAPFMPAILARLAPEFGAEVIFEPEFRIVGLIRFPNGRQSYFWHNKFNLNSVSAARLAQDKGYTVHFLQTLGFRVPRTLTFFREDFRRKIGSPRGLSAAQAFARELGWPVYVKPCRLSQGVGVSMATSHRALAQNARHAFEFDRTLLVQEACRGRDYRLVVLDGEVISAYERVPLSVIGDGTATIGELLSTRQREFDESGRDTQIDLEDPRLASTLSRQRLSRTSVLPPGHCVRLLDVANLSCGGTTVETTDRVHPEVAALSARIASALDLRFAGVDMILQDVSEPPVDYSILEVNSAPGLDHYASSGPAHEAHIDALYRKLLAAVARGPRSGSVECAGSGQGDGGPGAGRLASVFRGSSNPGQAH